MLRPTKDMPVERAISSRQLLGILFLLMAAMVYIAYLYAVHVEKSRMEAATPRPAAQQNGSANPGTSQNSPRTPDTE